MKLPVPRRPSLRQVALVVVALSLPMQGGCLCGCGVATAREGRSGLVTPVCREVSRRPATTPEAKGENK